jgi:hypothetical protein
MAATGETWKGDFKSESMQKGVLQNLGRKFSMPVSVNVFKSMFVWAQPWQVFVT